MTSPRPQHPPHHHRLSSPSPTPLAPQTSTPPSSIYPPPSSADTTQQQPQQHQTFSPFFTLISNPSSTAHKHPIVHYVFSDDDFDPLASLTSPPPPPPRPQSRQRERERDKDRIVIADMAPDGESVVAAHSLSEDWQVVGVNVSAAPQWMANPEDEGMLGTASGGSGAGSGGGAAGGLMLTIYGTEVASQGGGGGGGGSGSAAASHAGGGGSAGGKKMENLYELAEMFNERMAIIKSVIEYGDKAAPEDARLLQ